MEPFVWLPSTTGTGTTDTTPPLDVDLVGGLDAALPLAFAAHSPDRRFSVLADGFYLRLRNDDGLLQTTTQVSMLEIGCGLALDERRRWQAIAGLRYADVGYDVALGPLEGSAGVDWVDPWVGARGEFPLGERWSLELRGDVGGFGVGTDLTWQGLSYVRVRLGGSVSIDLGYRAIGVDYEESGVTYDVVFHGPVVGIVISF